eukprot:374914-Amphidinium_carterae.1
MSHMQRPCCAGTGACFSLFALRRTLHFNDLLKSQWDALHWKCLEALFLLLDVDETNEATAVGTGVHVTADYLSHDVRWRSMSLCRAVSG